MDFTKDYSGQQIGKYFLTRRLGNGSFGVVYKVNDRILKADKAIKILNVNDPQKVAALYEEAEIPYKCRHKNIVGINEANLVPYNNEILFIIDMQLVHDGSLEDMIKRKSLSTIECIDIFNNVLFGLGYAHGKGIIHRDIKPANILMDKGNPLISDFGLSTFIDTVILSKCWYITHAAPECFSQSIATEATDIYALGVTIYRVINSITDWHKFVTSIPNFENVLKCGKLVDRLVYKPHIPPQIIRIIRKACAQKPQNRYRSAADMRNDVLKLRYNYSWHQISENIWKGDSCNGSGQRDLSIENKKLGFEFVSKKSNRRINEECKLFNSLDNARNYLNEYIRSSTFI